MYAESPERGFMPGTGTLQSWRIPHGAVSFSHIGDVRVDSGVRKGDQVNTPFQCIYALLYFLCCTPHTEYQKLYLPENPPLDLIQWQNLKIPWLLSL